jgi:signal transduction histidine kinase
MTAFSGQPIQFLNQVMNGIPDMIYVVDMDTAAFEFLNSRVTDVLEYCAENEPGKRCAGFSGLVHADDVDRYNKHLAACRQLQDGETKELDVRLKVKGGSYRLFRLRDIVFKRKKDGSVSQITGIIRDADTPDVDDRKQQQEELAKNYRILQQAEELSHMGSWDYELSTKRFTWSDGMYSLFNLEKDTPVSPSIYLDYVVPADRHLAEKVVAAIQHGTHAFEETIRLQPGGIVKTLKIKAMLMHNDRGEPANMVGVDVDMSKIRLTEENLEEANQLLFKKNRQLKAINSELKTFNTLLVQDYQQTLRQVYTSLEMIISAESHHFSNGSRAHLRRTQSLLQRLNLLTNDIVSYSGIHAEDTGMTPVNLKEVIKTVMNDLREKMVNLNATITFGELPFINAYPLLLSVLFHHLLLNALKFKKEDRAPVIDIDCEKLKGADILHPDADPTQSYCRISVRDNGSGFDPAEKERIFDLFYQAHNNAKFRGTGVGLAIAKKIMTLHGGFIVAGSKPGEWAEFCCYFIA